MNKTTFRLLVVADQTLEHRKQVFLDAFEMLKKDYEVVEGLTLSYYFSFRSFEDVPWEDYWGDGKSLGIKLSWITKQNKKIKKQYGEEFHSVVYLVDKPNWKAVGIGGWNLGRFFSGMSVQLTKGYFTTDSAHKVTSMEVAHCLNEQVYEELGVRLKDVLKVKNWDYEVVHGEHPDYQKYYYKNAFVKIGDVLLRTFQKREIRFTKQLEGKIMLLEKVLGLLRWIRRLKIQLSSKASPVYDSEIEKVVDNN